MGKRTKGFRDSSQEVARPESNAHKEYLERCSEGTVGNFTTGEFVELVSSRIQKWFRLKMLGV